MRGARLLQLLSSPWALEPRAFEVMCAVVQRWARSEAAPPAVLQQVRADADERDRRRGRAAASSGQVAVIPIYGVLSQRGNMIDEISGGGSTSTQMLTGALREAVADDTVDAILLDVDSPGGEVFGIQELADELYQARQSKPIVAVANSLCASAAYWLASQASELYCTPSGEVGSIGVIGAHTDLSGADDAAGVKITYITAGKYKSEGNPHEPLAPEAQAYQQSRVDDYYSAFTRAVARGRGTTVAVVRGESYGEGRALGAKDAVAAGMVNGIGTFDQALARARTLARSPQAPPSARAGVCTDPVRGALAAAGRARLALACEDLAGTRRELQAIETALRGQI